MRVIFGRRLDPSWKVDGDMLMLKVGDNSNIWTGAVGDGDLSNPQNWYGGQVPTSGTAIFNCGAETSMTKGDTFAPTSITFGPGCAPVTINGGNLTGIGAVTNLSSVVQTINCPVTFADNYRVHCASAAVNFSGGATATCPVSDMTDNAASRALTGNITFTEEEWKVTGSMNNKYTVPSGSRLCGKHLTGKVDNKTFLCVQAGGYAEFDSILTGKALGRVSVQGELVVHDKWVATATANYNHIGEDNSSTETNIVVKISSSNGKRPYGGVNVLTSGGKFSGVTVSKATDTPDWVKDIYVDDDGNIVLLAKPRGTQIIVR